MPEKSLFNIDIPLTDVLSYLFPEGTIPSDKPIWIDAERPEKSLSPKQLLQWATRLGTGLKTYGLQQGDVVLVVSTNHIFIPMVYLAVAGHGYVFSGSNPAYGINETKFQIENTGAKLMLVDPSLLDIALLGAEKAGFPKDRIYLFDDEECQSRNGLTDWRTLLGSLEDAQPWRRMSMEESKTRTAVLNYSSGTTGFPKGVMISHQNIIANVEQSLFMRNLRTASAASYEKPTSDERWLGFLPLYHAYGQLWSISAAARTLTPVFFMRSFNYRDWLRHVATHKITHIQTAPPIVVMLAKRPETKEYDLSSLRNILCGAAPLSKELQNEVSAKIGHGLRVVQTWGMTEVTCSSLHVPGLMDDDSGSVGLIDPNCEMKLLDEDGKEVGDGDRGEIWVRGPNICQGYWRNEAATRDTFDTEGFLKTGDVAIKQKGWYRIVDRKKELIKVKGFQVAPAELEAVLLEHEDVADSAVVALQMDHEERPRAYLALKDHAKGKLKEEDMVKWMAQRVAKHKQLTGGVMFVDEVPKSPSGKIQRVIMRQWAARDAKEVRQPKAKLISTSTTITPNQQNLISKNTTYASTYTQTDLPSPPAKKYALVTCMDARIDTAAAFGISLGDAHIIRNAGGSAREALRSLIISQQLLGTTEIFVVKHTRCGMLTFRNAEARALVETNLGEEAGKAVKDLDFLTFEVLEEGVREDVEWLKEQSTIAKEVSVSGWVYEVETGKVRQVL